MNTPASSSKVVKSVKIRPLLEVDLPEAHRLMGVAFGTFIGLPDPSAFLGDKSYIATRWKADPTAAFGAEVEGRLAGSNFAGNWGSVGYFGPLTIDPVFWDCGLGKRLMEPVLARFAEWGMTHTGLFTFAQSNKHVGLYRRFGFWPRFLTAVMSRPVVQREKTPSWTRLSAVPEAERAEVVERCRRLTDALYEGLDLSREMAAVSTQKLGDTVLLWEDGELVGFAVCHCGPGTEAGSGVCYVKFGASRSGSKGEATFTSLLAACEAFAAQAGLKTLMGGVNTARHEAYRVMLERGFRTEFQGVIMQQDNQPGYNRPGVFLIDDWR